MNEKQPESMATYNERDENGNIKPVGRRGFLRGVVATVASVALGYEIIKSPDEKENVKESTGDLYERFKGQESNFFSARDAADLLCSELDVINKASVKISGDDAPNNRIEILRTFLTAHLQTKGVGEKYDHRDEIISRGIYNKNILLYIRGL